MKITLKEYDSTWPLRLEEEKKELHRLLAGLSPVIEHIGSTSIPGLAAKPIIDIMIGFSSPEDLDAAVECFRLPDYRYFQKYEDVMPFRRFIVKGAFAGNKVPWKVEQDTRLPFDFSYTVTHNIHMVETSSGFWHDHLLFRDYLRANDDARIAYELLKMHLSEKEWSSVNDYASAKAPFIRSVMDKAKNEFRVEKV